MWAKYQILLPSILWHLLLRICTTTALIVMVGLSALAQNDRPPPPPPPPPEPKVEEIFRVVEHMPRFQGCEDVPNKEQRDSCARKKLEAFVYSEIIYPDKAKKLRITGTVEVSFIVNTNGSVTVGEVIKDIGGNCGEEALRVIGLINEKGLHFYTGGGRGRPVRVQFIMPINFTEEMLQRSRSN